MAKLYLLTPEQVKSGQKPKIKYKRTWGKIAFVLSMFILIEHAAFLWMWMH